MRAVDATGTREIEEAVQRALAAGGVQGTVTLSGRTMTLRTGGAPVEIDAAYLVEQWPLLPEDLRERKATDVAARLTDALRAAKAGAPAPSAPAPRYTPSVRPTGVAARGPSKPMVLPLGTILLVAGLAAAGWWFWKRARPMGTADTGGSGAPASTASAAPETEDQRRARVCEVARKRVLETRSLAGLDAQVWLTELWLATSKPGDDMARSKGVTDLIDQGTRKLTAAADPDLAAIAEAQVELDADESARAGVPWRGVRVRFRGGYVSAFFEPPGRERLHRVAQKLADATGAEMGALYARCSHLRYHDVGAWFRGATPPLAASALVYSMGFFSERRLTNHDPSAPPTASDLVALTVAMTKVEKGTFETAVREVGGTYAPGAGESPTVISFPLGGPTLAARVAGSLATSAGRGPDAPRPAASP
jgi:serine/threonine-protein kinase